MKYDAIVGGGGLVGLAVAYQLLQNRPDLKILVLEKEAALGRHQSGSNSGVLHAGLYYKPGSKKALLGVRGLKMMVRFCEDYGIKHEICGKLVVAANDAEVMRLKVLFERGTANGLANLRWLDASGIREREPSAAGVAAIHVPEEGIVDYPGVIAKLAGIIQNRGGEIHRTEKITGCAAGGTSAIVTTTLEKYETKLFVACAGLYADRVARSAGVNPGMKIVPFRGEYYKLGQASEHLVRHLIYPVPDPAFPFLGVHFTRLIHGGIEAGPNAVLALSREGYSWKDIDFLDMAETLSYSGLWKFLLRYPKMSWYEIRRSMSLGEFCRSLQKLVPAITPKDLVQGGAGVRAQAMWPDGNLVEDFHITVDGRTMHVLNAPSPAATASLAIGEEIAGRILQNLFN
jgi:L-2-hydroxyglutarate oxidase LhgO